MVVRIHPGQSSNPFRLLERVLLLLLLGPPMAVPAVGQEGSAAVPSDSVEIREAAGREQARFERTRRRYSPEAAAGWGGRCDEIVGRICLRLDGAGDWWPGPESPRVTEARRLLITHLDSAGARMPGDAWILGQRAIYRVASEALGIVRDCGAVDSAWCAALEGYLLHVLHRFPEAAVAFRIALDGMPAAERMRWTDPRVLVDREGREALDDATPDRRAGLVQTFWAFADPLSMVDGNDRWTEHLARQVVVRAREESANPFNLRWGDDLAESLLRYGWEVGWEQIAPRPSELTTISHAVGHQHPESRSYVPPGKGLTRLAETTWEDWNPGSRFLPRTGYAPSYAPVILPAGADLYRVPRGDTLVVVAALALPPDTSRHREHDHDRPPVPAAFRSMPPQVGLFALNGQGEVAAARVSGLRGVVRVALPPGEYLLSGEVWAPDSARAGRHREGLRWTARPPDLPTASDLFLLEAGGEGDVRSLEDAMSRLLFGRLVPGQTFRVGWELNGFGWRPETLGYRLEIREAPGGFLRRAGRFLGLVGSGEVTRLEWSEAGPEAPGPFFRSAEVSLPTEMDDGQYRIRLEIRAPGRETLVLQRGIRLTTRPR